MGGSVGSVLNPVSTIAGAIPGVGKVAGPVAGFITGGPLGGFSSFAGQALRGNYGGNGGSADAAAGGYGVGPTVGGMPIPSGMGRNFTVGGMRPGSYYQQPATPDPMMATPAATMPTFAPAAPTPTTSTPGLPQLSEGNFTVGGVSVPRPGMQQVVPQFVPQAVFQQPVQQTVQQPVMQQPAPQPAIQQPQGIASLSPGNPAATNRLRFNRFQFRRR